MSFLFGDWFCNDNNIIIINKKRGYPFWDNLFKKVGGYLLFHLDGSTIGVGGLNFSVRNGKRCISTAITTLIRLNKTY